jgi:hypothetical protein
MANKIPSVGLSSVAVQRESRLGRALWIAIVVVLGGYVVTDFVRSPFLAPSGSAAVRGPAVTLWAPAAEYGGETGVVLDRGAAALELNGHPTAVKSLSGGTAQAVIDFFSGYSGSGGDLLVVTSTTLADLAHDRHDLLVPGAAEQAAIARELLRRAEPVGMLESEPYSLAVGRESAIRSGSGLLAALARSPRRQLFAIEDDTFSRDQLAALVDRAGVDGEVHFGVFQSAAEAGGAIASGTANVVLAPRGALREEVAAGRLRELAWPLRGAPPRTWIALVARPHLPAHRLAHLRRWVRALSGDRRWAAQLRREGRSPASPGTRRLAGLLADTGRADRLERLAQSVERH